MVTEASVGDVKIVVAENEFEFAYSKVAEYKNGRFVLLEPYENLGVDLNQIRNSQDLKSVIEKISTYKLENKLRVKTENQIANINNLEEGVYLIEGIANQKYQIPSSLISIPSWENGEMIYQLSVFPKIQENVEVVETGDTTQITFLIILCMISLLIVLCLSCVFFRTVLQ